MARTLHNEALNNYKIEVENEEIVPISENEFNKINNLYHFVKNSNHFYDKKREKTVARKEKQLLSGDYLYHFNKNWLKKELLVTNSNTLLDICKNNELLYDIYLSYLNKKKQEKHYEALNSMLGDMPNEEELTTIY